MLPKLLTAPALFYDTLPPHQGLWLDLYTAVAQGNLVAALTRGLLESSDSIDTSLSLWELRLTAFILHGNLAIAKQEAVALNNALYMAENDTNDVLVTELLAVDPAKVLPLPRNNDRLISHRLLVLLLRLKSVPNLNLVNEWYKLCYQLRLKSGTASAQLSAQLACLSYDIMVILVINKNYTTLHSFLGSLVYDDPIYGDRILLMDLIVQIICYNQNGVSRDQIIDKISAFTISDNVKADLLYVLNHFSPLYAQGATAEQEKATALIIEDFDTEKLVDLVLEGHITGRIICCVLGVWDVQTNFGYKLEDFKGSSNVESPQAPSLEDCKNLINQKWKLYVNKVYGLE